MPDYCFKVRLSDVSARQLSSNIPRSPDAVPFYRLDFNGKVIQSDICSAPGDPAWAHKSTFEYRLSESSFDACLQSLAARYAVMHVLFLEPNTGREITIGSCSVDLLSLASGAARCAFDLRHDPSSAGGSAVEHNNTTVLGGPVTAGAITGKVEFTISMEQQCSVSIELQSISVSPMPAASPYKLSYALLSSGGAHEIDSNVISATIDPTWDAQLMPRIISRCTLKELLNDTLRVTIRDVSHKGAPAVGKFDVIFSDIIQTHLSHTAQFRRNAYAVGTAETKSLQNRQNISNVSMGGNNITQQNSTMMSGGGDDGLVRSFSTQNNNNALGATSSWGALVTGSILFRDMPQLAQLVAENSSNINGTIHGRPLLKSCMVPANHSKYPSPAASSMMLANTSRATNKTFIQNGGVPVSATTFHNDLYGPPTVPMSDAGQGSVAIAGQTFPIGMNLSNMTTANSMAPPSGPVGFFPTSPKKVQEVGGAAGGSNMPYSTDGTTPMTADAVRAQLQQMEERKAKFNIAPPPSANNNVTAMHNMTAVSGGINGLNATNVPQYPPPLMQLQQQQMNGANASGRVTVTHHHHYGGGRGGAVAAAAASVGPSTAASSANTSVIDDRYKSPPKQQQHMNASRFASPVQHQQQNESRFASPNRTGGAAPPPPPPPAAEPTVVIGGMHDQQQQQQYSMVDPLFRVHSRRGSMSMMAAMGQHGAAPPPQSRFESPDRTRAGGADMSASAIGASAAAVTSASMNPTHVVSRAAVETSILPRHTSPTRGGGMAANNGAASSAALSRALSPIHRSSSGGITAYPAPRGNLTGGNPITATGQALVDQYREAVAAIEEQMARVAMMQSRIDEQTEREDQLLLDSLAQLQREESNIALDLEKCGRAVKEMQRAAEDYSADEHKNRLDTEMYENGLLNELDDVCRVENELLALMERVHFNILEDQKAKEKAQEERSRALMRLDATSREFNDLSHRVRVQNQCRSPLRSISPFAGGGSGGGAGALASRSMSRANSMANMQQQHHSSSSHHHHQHAASSSSAMMRSTSPINKTNDYRDYEPSSHSLAMKSNVNTLVPQQQQENRGYRNSYHDDRSAISSSSSYQQQQPQRGTLSPIRDRTKAPLDVRHHNPSASSSSFHQDPMMTSHRAISPPRGGGASSSSSRALATTTTNSSPTNRFATISPPRGRGMNAVAAAAAIAAAVNNNNGAIDHHHHGGGGSIYNNRMLPTNEQPTVLPPLKVNESRALSPNSQRSNRGFGSSEGMARSNSITDVGIKAIPTDRRRSSAAAVTSPTRHNYQNTVDTSSSNAAAGMNVTMALDTKDLGKAIESGNVPLFRSVLAQNPDVLYANNSWLHAACAVDKPSYEIVSAIVTMRPELCHAVDTTTGNVPLHFLCAAREPSAKVADCLLAASGASAADPFHGPITVFNNNGLNPFHVAVLNVNDVASSNNALTSSNESLKQFLIRRCGGKKLLNSKTAKGESAPHLCAIHDKYLPTLRFLHNSGASCTETAIVVGDRHSASLAVTPLEKARMYGNITTEVQRYLQHVAGC